MRTLSCCFPSWRPYITLLRLRYQFQLGPIFGWGFLLSGGRLDNGSEALRVGSIFLAFHIGAFGGLTALNSFYDRDDGPVGGLWAPPPPPKYLWAFAWAIQLAGLVLLLILDYRLAVIYALIVTLALGYSHPKVRWKSHPWKSVIVVAIGQGVLDFTAGALTAQQSRLSASDSLALAGACLGATAIVCAFFPLTQLFQIEDDKAHGDRTTVIELQEKYGLNGPFRWAQCLLGVGVLCNMSALSTIMGADWLVIALAIAGLCGGLWAIELWRRDYGQRHPSGAQPVIDSRARDFGIVHRLFGATSLLFALLIVGFLLRGRFT